MPISPIVARKPTSWILAGLLSLLLAPALSPTHLKATHLQAAEPSHTIESAQTTLGEIMAIPASQIPAKLLQEAEAVAIIPNVVKIGFVAGVRRGQGVVVIKDQDGDWGLPTFVTLTGGSIGWQAGAQSTDVILVFTTRRSIEGLMKGKFTLGADAAVSAGPVGRQVAAATDTNLKAEILSYSRSRGLFAGVALDGSAIQINANEHQQYYGAGPSEAPAQVPIGATRLVETIARFAGGHAATATAAAPGNAPGAVPHLPDAQLDKLRQDLVQSSIQMQRIIDEKWQMFLALPQETYQRDRLPTPAALQDAVGRYRKVIDTPEYQALAQRPEFQNSYRLLLDYQKAVTAALSGNVALPPPPPVAPRK